MNDTPIQHAGSSSAAVNSKARAQAVAVFADNLARLRRKSGLSQAQVSNRPGIHTTEVSRMERGLRDPQLSTLIRLARALDVSSGDLLARL